MGLFAGEKLELAVPQKDKRLLTIVETDGCFSDGVAVATNCWVGKRTMRVEDFGKIAATFVDTHSATAIRIHPHPACRMRASQLALNARSRWHAQLEAYQIMSDMELLRAQEVRLQIDLAAIISRNGIRATCERCGEEIINEREVCLAGSTLCRGCAGEAYYEPLAEAHPKPEARVALQLR